MTSPRGRKKHLRIASLENLPVDSARVKAKSPPVNVKLVSVMEGALQRDKEGTEGASTVVFEEGGKGISPTLIST